MIVFLRNWVQGIAVAVILTSIFEMILPNSSLKKYIKIVLGIYIVFSIISPFVNDNVLYSFDITKEAENMIQSASDSASSSVEIENNFEDMYIDTLEEKIVSTIEKYGYNVRSCLVDANFEGDEDELGINRVIIVLSSKNDKFYSKEEKTNIKSIQKVEINVTNPDNENLGNEISSDDIDDVKKYICDYYDIDEKIVDIQAY